MDIKTKINEAIKDMATKVSRDTKHIYRHSETGDMYQGVSTVSSIIPKDWLAAWGAKEAVKFLGYSDYPNDTKRAEEIIEKIKQLTPEQLIEFLKEAKGASSRKSKQAMVDGKKGHIWLESYVQAKITAKEPPLLPINTPLERPLSQFLEWEIKEVDYWIASEAIVTRPDKRYGGQLDMIYMSKSGKLCIGDFKFASHIDQEYYLQTAGYAACFEPYGITFDDRVIIRLPKTLEREEWDTKEFKYYKVPNNIEVRIVPTPYIGDREAFFASLIVKSWINYACPK